MASRVGCREGGRDGGGRCQHAGGDRGQDQGELARARAGVRLCLPSNTGGALWGDPQTTAHALSPWTGFACLRGYAIVLTALAAWQLRRRDA